MSWRRSERRTQSVEPDIFLNYKKIVWLTPLQRFECALNFSKQVASGNGQVAEVKEGTAPEEGSLIETPSWW